MMNTNKANLCQLNRYSGVENGIKNKTKYLGSNVCQKYQGHKHYWEVCNCKHTSIHTMDTFDSYVYQSNEL